MEKISKPSKLWQLALLAVACKCSSLRSINLNMWHSEVRTKHQWLLMVHFLAHH